MATAADRLESINKKLEQLKAQKRQLEARQRAAESKAKRGADTRRKILVGALVLSKLDDPQHREHFRDFLSRELHTFLTRADDRALFADLLGTAPSGQADPHP